MFINFDIPDNGVGVITVTPISFTKDGLKSSPKPSDEEKFRVSSSDIFSTVLSIVFRLIAVSLNISLAIEYYNRKLFYYSGWTVLCIVLPCIITTLIYVKMYLDDCNAEGSCKKWSAGKIIWVLFITPFFFRYWRSLIYSIKCKRCETSNNLEAQKKYYKKMMREECDVALVRIFECTLETTPQKVLQIGIILSDLEINLMQFLAILSYFGSMAWCIVFYNRYNRFYQKDKEQMTTSAVTLQFLFNFCLLVGRTLSIAIVASLFPLEILIACLLHAFAFGLATFFIDRPTFCSKQCFGSMVFSMLLGCVYIFMYILTKEGKTFFKYLCYYGIYILENVVCVVVFWMFALTRLSFILIPLVVLPLALSFFGVIFMIVYYKFYHPNITARREIVLTS
ncbi:hypothetical protein ACFFRR_003241 [Megaselia abdita]